jgi:DNA-binding PadR family transcriptional regulator
MLELAILGLLKEQELHGYELKKRLVEQLGFGSGVSFGSLYPALSRLEQAGAVKAVEHLGAAGAKPASRAGRARKVYGITERGEALFEELLAAGSTSSDDDRLFNLRLAFARYLPPEARIGLLERRRVLMTERVALLRQRVKAVRDAYARSLVEHDREAAERDLTWIDRLLAAERSGGVESPAPAGRTAAPSISGLRPPTPNIPNRPEEDKEK